jgi:peptide deformylase
MHHACRLIETFDESLARLVADMAATMHAADGVGLAANQVGLDLALFVFSCPDEDDVLHEGVVCNPVLMLPEGRDRELDESDEGCLSLPGAYVPCARPDRATVRGVDASGAALEITGTGLLARCLQHETDHTNGIVFGDRLSKRWRRKLYAEHEKLADNYPSDWPATPSPAAG